MQPAEIPRQRIQSIDMLRGIVMLVMALDHVRDYTHITAMTADPLDLATTTPILFFTRWITHFCAPVFVFLSGTSAFLASQKKSTRQASAFMIKRGIWLVIVEVTLITLALSFNPFYNSFFLQVIWAIGCSMIILGLLQFTSLTIIAIAGCLLVFGHDIFDFISLPEHTAGRWLTSVFFTTTDKVIPLNATHFVFDLYAVLPWTGIMLLGYVFGTVYRTGANAPETKRKILLLGVGVTALFIILRFSNYYGDPSKWSEQKDVLFTILSFVNTSKYPPSLLYTCMTIGPALLLLSVLEPLQSPFSRILRLYGRVPFFYYVCHFYLIHTIGVVLFFASDFGVDSIADPKTPFLFRPAQFGVSLPYVYMIWLLVIIILYQPCKWFDRYRSTHRQWWLSYL